MPELSRFYRILPAARVIPDTRIIPNRPNPPGCTASRGAGFPGYPGCRVCPGFTGVGSRGPGCRGYSGFPDRRGCAGTGSRVPDCPGCSRCAGAGSRGPACPGCSGCPRYSGCAGVGLCGPGPRLSRLGSSRLRRRGFESPWLPGWSRSTLVIPAAQT